MTAPPIGAVHPDRIAVGERGDVAVDSREDAVRNVPPVSEGGAPNRPNARQPAKMSQERPQAIVPSRPTEDGHRERARRSCFAGEDNGDTALLETFRTIVIVTNLRTTQNRSAKAEKNRVVASDAIL